jgi:hypothetical protein
MKNTAHPMDRTTNWCSHGGWFILAIKVVKEPNNAQNVLKAFLDLICCSRSVFACSFHFRDAYVTGDYHN